MDPRPLTGEPLALDLINTEWISTSGRQDLLATDAGFRIWLQANGLLDDPVARGAREATIEARATLREVLEGGSSRAVGRLNAVLAHGRLREHLGADGPERDLELDDRRRRYAWLAAASYLDLLQRAPGRIRACGNPDCILFFFDDSKNGTRRWCSMATCGNRLKARRHYDRVKGG